jgi:hypothetical protein
MSRNPKCVDSLSSIQTYLENEVDAEFVSESNAVDIELSKGDNSLRISMMTLSLVGAKANERDFSIFCLRADCAIVMPLLQQ